MNDEAVTPVAAPVTPKAAPKTKKKNVKKAAPVAKLSKNGRGRSAKDGLRAPQYRILKALSKSNRAMTKPEIAAKSEVDPTKMGEYLGPRDGETKKAQKRYPFPGLFELGMVRESLNEEGAAVRAWVITSKGRKALA